MSRFGSLLVDSRDGVMRVTLHRPDRRNALNGRMVEDLAAAFEEAGRNPAARVVILAASGPAFCAGADVQWLLGDGTLSEARALADAERLLHMYDTVDRCPCPVIARVQGPTYGGGLGLVAVCDIVAAADEAVFALSEARLGMVPAAIGPLLIRKAGASFIRRYGLTGEAFSAEVAQRYHLVHDVVPLAQLDERVEELAAAVRRLAPQATRHTKQFFRDLQRLSDHEQRDAGRDANVRARLSPEAREGLRAFLDQRAPSWAEVEKREANHAVRP